MATTLTPRLHSSSTTAGARRHRRRFSWWHLFLLPTALIFLIPFVQMVLASLSASQELVKFPPPYVPSRLTLAGYIALFTRSEVLRWLTNTVIVSAAAIGSNLVLCSLAGYGFARLRFGGRNVGFFAIVATIMIPTQLLMIPAYVMFARLGLLNGLGEANPDLIVTGDVVPRFGQAEQLLDHADLVLGGSAAIAASGLARLGVRTALAAVVGADVFASWSDGC